MDIDYLIAAAIGLSQITDEEMTVEEAFDLHLTEQEVALTAGDWQISYTAPREVAHIICKNPATGMTKVLCSAPGTVPDGIRFSGNLRRIDVSSLHIGYSRGVIE